MELNDIHQLFIVSIKDLFSAETQLTHALPKMAEAATEEKLKIGFQEHLKQTEDHLQRLEQVAENLDFSPRGHACKGMQGLIEEGAEFIKMDGEPSVIDAALISAAQRVEHYEIAGYGCAVALAEIMGHTEEAKLLKQTLDEERETDEKLTEIAQEKVNPAALKTVEDKRME